jgi:phosphopentomutase
MRIIIPAPIENEGDFLYNRAIIIVLDSVGIGEMPDAKVYGDCGSNTICNIADSVGGLKLPHLQAMGLGNIASVKGVAPVSNATAAYGKMAEKSQGKDTTTGHWEMAGTPILTALPTYPHGFPAEVTEPFQKAIGRKILGNTVASGTAIIEKLGAEHMQTGYPIVYTSADSVFQIAAHEEVITLEELYDMCLKARNILTGKHAVARVIARPFTGKAGDFRRTANRRDFSLLPPKGHLMSMVEKAGLPSVSVGKIHDIFAENGVTDSFPTKNNADGINKLLQAMAKYDKGLIWANLVDFDMVYGHRNDVQGYGKALEEFDALLPQILAQLHENDILFITADHGADPTTESTDHSREYVPLLVYGKKVHPVDLGLRQTFADVGATVADYLQVTFPPTGTSMLKSIK